MPETTTPAAPNSKTDYRSTLNLPTTEFPMRADLPKREPARVQWWAAHDAYVKRLERNRAEGGTSWILHDGPPYANGDLHMGHFLNRFLKDAFVKIALLDGRWADFIPGWDMHGLPIERETLKHLGGVDFHKIDPIELRAECKKRALYWLDRQRASMLRMGLFGHYDRPYMTIAPEFEATIVDTLADLAESGQLYKGLRSTLWCVYDETALAEAEIEYKDKTSPSIYVRFHADAAQRADLLGRFGLDEDGTPLSIVIWTTTPWTLPANVAIALKPDADYGVYRIGNEDHIFAAELEPAVLAQFGPEATAGERARVAGQALVGASVRHPFLDRDSLIVAADYVELQTGTGAVHTAPGHGTDDFETGVKYGLPILNPVDAAGTFLADAGPYAGLNIFAAQQQIIDDLAASGALVRTAAYEHSYPHCWRCKNPVVFRATAQWFISMDRNGLRERIGAEIPGVNWVPSWGQTRMTQMIDNHPEWCISRQRTWGTPIPAVVCKTCGESTVDPGVARQVAARYRREGPALTNASDMWWTDDVATFLPADFRCPKCAGSSFEKEFNIVDIWFESGVTHRAVLRNGGLPWPADLYLEGSDQYRGWFRSNLITAVATLGAPPYKGVVSTGMVVDADGRAMHKSDGNYIGAVEGMDKYGADVLRLWAASVEYTADMRLGAKMLENVANVYRNLRNRLRYFLSNISDLPAEAVVPRVELEPVDRLALAALDRLAKDVVGHYRAFRLHDAYLALVAFDNDDLSAFYLVGLKDRLYSSAAGALRRRSAQSALLEMLRTLAVLLAPVLSFTAEEAWQSVPAALRGTNASVFDLPFPHIEGVDPAALADWALLKELRAVVAATGAKDFTLDARVEVPPELQPRMRALGDNLREMLVVSTLSEIAVPGDGVARVITAPASGDKCDRCWKYLPLGSDPHHPAICAPCAAIVGELTV